MLEDDLKSFYRRYIAALNGRQFDVVRELIADEVHMNGVLFQSVDVVASIKAIVEAVPDWTWNIEELFAQDDRIAARLQDTGTPVKQFLGHEPTGASLDIMEYASYRVRHGKFVEMYFLLDTAAVAAQLRGDT
jgi:predicted ester cyclase